MLSIAISDTLASVLRAEQQDFQGTAGTVDLARRLDPPRLLLLLNKLLRPFDRNELGRQLLEAYQAPLTGILPLSKDMGCLASSAIFTLHQSGHPITVTLRRVASALQ